MKNVLITGASGNLGKVVVDRFLKDNYHVLVTSSVKSAPSSMANVFSYKADLTKEESAANAVRQILSDHTKIDVAVLLVGGFAMGGFKESDGLALDKMFSLNFNTAYFMARPVFQQMLHQPEGGRIILIGARPALRAKDGKNMVAYSLSKSLLFKLAELLNAEGELKNVTTSVIVPGTIDTEANRKAMPQADFSKWVNPADIAEAISYICSAKGSGLRETIFKMYGQG